MVEFIAKYFLIFIIYSFLGWVWEVVLSLIQRHKFVNRGFLNGPYCPIYGVGVLLFLFIQTFTTRPVELFFIGAVTACTVEYITSWTMEKLFHARWWDYSDSPMNLNGRICLSGFLVFGAFSAGLPYFHIHIENFLGGFEQAHIVFMAVVLAIVFVLDVIATNTSLAKLNSFLRKYTTDRIKLPAFLQERLDQGKIVFSRQQQRIMAAFPAFRSLKYSDSFERLKKLNERARKKILNSKFKPIKKK